MGEVVDIGPFTVLTNGVEIRAVFKQLCYQLEQGSTHISRYLNFPPRPVEDAKLFWHEKNRVWFYVRDDFSADFAKNRYYCGCGTDVGHPGDKLSVSVEINIPRQGIDVVLACCRRPAPAA